MTLSRGEKVHIIERRYFEEDLRRHFVGEIVGSSEQSIRVEGYTWVMDTTKGEFVRKREKRLRVLYPGERTIIHVIPHQVDVAELKYVVEPKRGRIVTDDEQFALDISEYSAQL